MERIDSLIACGTATVSSAGLVLRWFTSHRGLVVDAVDNGATVILRITNAHPTNAKFVTRLGGRIGRARFQLRTQLDPQLPLRLEPEETVSVEVRRDLVVKPDLRWLAAWDTLGRCYKVKRRTIRQLFARGVVLSPDSAGPQAL